MTQSELNQTMTRHDKTCETCRYRIECEHQGPACEGWQETSSVTMTFGQGLEPAILGPSYYGKAPEKMIRRLLQLIDAICDAPVHVQIDVRRKETDYDAP